MEHLNQMLFLLMNAGPHAAPGVVASAKVLAEAVNWLVPAGLVVGWLWGPLAVRRALLAAALSGLTALLTNQLIGLVWYHPRPFEMGLGRTLLVHVADSSFPSDHLSLIWATAFALMLHARTRFAGGALALAGLPVAWARVYLGVHFPLDMAGAAGVAACTALFVHAQGRRFVETLTDRLVVIYRRVFAAFIRRGWVQQ